MATAAQVEAFRRNSNGLVSLAQSDLRAFWSALDLAGNPLLVRAALEEFMPDLVDSYGSTAALLGADFYDESRGRAPSAARFQAILSEPPDISQAQAVSRWGLGPLFQSEPDAPQALLDLLGATQRLVLQSARGTIFNSAARDSVQTGFARIPRGLETCHFCTMIASRGAVYYTAETAGQSNEWHNDCDCVIAPISSRDGYPEGYDPNRFLSLYAQGKGVGRDD